MPSPAKPVVYYDAELKQWVLACSKEQMLVLAKLIGYSYCSQLECFALWQAVNKVRGEMEYDKYHLEMKNGARLPALDSFTLRTVGKDVSST